MRSRPRSRSPLARRRRAERRGDLAVVDRLEEAEHRVAAALVLVPALVDLGADPADRLAVALGDEVLGLGVLEVGVLPAVEELHPLEDQRRHPLRVVAVEPEGDLDEALQVALACATGRIETPAIGSRNLHFRP